MKKKEIDKKTKQIALDMTSPIGQIPLEKVLRHHKEFIQDLKLIGATWEQISRLFANNGIFRKNGNPIPASQLRATMSRIQKGKVETVERVSEVITQQQSSSGKQQTNPAPIKGFSTDGNFSEMRKKMDQAVKTRK